MLAFTVVASLAACAKAPAASKAATDPSGVVIQADEKSGQNLLDFTKAPRAAERIGIDLTEVGEQAGGDGERRLVVPHAAVLYTAQGEAFVYTQAEPLVFVRHPIVIERIEESTAVLTAGPPPGTPVVTDGAAELTGIEFGVGK